MARRRIQMAAAAMAVLAAVGVPHTAALPANTGEELSNRAKRRARWAYGAGILAARRGWHTAETEAGEAEAWRQSLRACGATGSRCWSTAEAWGYRVDDRSAGGAAQRSMAGCTRRAGATTRGTMRQRCGVWSVEEAWTDGAIAAACIYARLTRVGAPCGAGCPVTPALGFLRRVFRG
jgi:hypothetical protein